MTVFVISKDGKPLMPTSRFGKVRHMIKDGRAVVYCRNPFTIQLTYDTTDYTQPIEICQDTGYQHIGVSVKSESAEYVSAQYDLLKGEKEHLQPNQGSPSGHRNPYYLWRSDKAHPVRHGA